MRELGLEPRSQRWQRRILTTILHPQRTIKKTTSLLKLWLKKHKIKRWPRRDFQFLSRERTL